MIQKRRISDLIVLSIRILLALIFISYGTGKLSGGQFGNLTEKELATPIKDLSLFKIAWYLFDHQPFKIFIGVSQIIASLMLLYNRTMIIGALMLAPIVLNILIIDLTIMPYGLKLAFAFRLTGYLCYIGLLLFYYKNQLTPVWKTVSNIKPMRSENQKAISYLLVILFIPALELAPGVLKIIYFAVTHPQSFWNGIKALF
uniref:DoxX family protein n=1 Tax=Sphingobacterium sp. (strain 21) TaxID=743722 RepID=F4CBL1_SPHS2